MILFVERSLLFFLLGFPCGGVRSVGWYDRAGGWIDGWMDGWGQVIDKFHAGMHPPIQLSAA